MNTFILDLWTLNNVPIFIDTEGSSQEKCSRVSVLYTGHVKEAGLSYVVGAPVSCTMGH